MNLVESKVSIKTGDEDPHEKVGEEEFERMRRKKELKQKAKLKIEQGLSLEDILKEWDQCCYFMRNKRRLCNIARATGSLFCGNHRPAGDTPTQRIVKKANEVGFSNVDRIPCPVDPSHTIYAHNLKTHEKICNIRMREKSLEAQPYYCQNCNSGHAKSSPTVLENRIVDSSILIAKIRKCYNDYVVNQICEYSEGQMQSVKANEVERRVLQEVANDQSSFEKLRHAKQDVCIVNQMIVHNLLEVDVSDGITCDDENDSLKPSEKVSYIELGAGKGFLGLAISSVQSKAHITLVERGGFRRKADKSLRDYNRNFSRVRMDIRHCFVPKLPGVYNTSETLVGNIHLVLLLDSFLRS
jgi:tRNA:m4X modification enzyme